MKYAVESQKVPMSKIWKYVDNQKLTNSTAMAEAFNEHFSTIGCIAN